MAIDRHEFVRCARCKWIYALANAQPGDQLTDPLRCNRNCDSTKFYSDDGSGVADGATVPVLVVAKTWEPDQELYKCSSCHGIYAKTWSDEIADAEFAIEFHGSTDTKIIVCDECYQAMMKAFRPTAYHMH